MPQVFISYASEDAFFAEFLKKNLLEKKIDVWLDQVELKAGEEWRDKIDQGISESDALIVVLTPESCESAYVTYEWAFGMGLGVAVIPILHKKSNPHPRLAVFQYLDFTEAKNAPWDDLYERVSANDNGSSKKRDRVGDMTGDELRELLRATFSLANATAKVQGRPANTSDITEAADSIVSVTEKSTYSKETREENKRNTILWVDDRPHNNANEREMFESMGFDFELALSTDEAVSKFEPGKYHSIISDMGRVEGPQEGYVLLDKIRVIDKNVPYFIYAGSDEPKHKRLALEKGSQGSTNSPRELLNMVAGVKS